MGQRAIPSWISRHSYLSAAQTVKNKKLDHRVIVFGPGTPVGNRGAAGRAAGLGLGLAARAAVRCRARRGVDRGHQWTIGLGWWGDLCYSHGMNLHGRGRLMDVAVGES